VSFLQIPTNIDVRKNLSSAPSVHSFFQDNRRKSNSPCSTSVRKKKHKESPCPSAGLRDRHGALREGNRK